MPLPVLVPIRLPWTSGTDYAPGVVSQPKEAIMVGYRPRLCALQYTPGARQR
jgi:hypothetical protein